jgi:ankyrin repeat protein
MWFLVVTGTLALATYWQTGRCAEADLGAGAKLRTCVESVAITESGSLELLVSWRSSGLEGKRIDKGSDSKNRRMYLLDSEGRRYDHTDTRDAARDGGRLTSDSPMLRGVFSFPAPSSGTSSFTFRDDDQKIAIDGISLSPELSSDAATNAPLLATIARSETIRIDYGWGESRERYLLRRTESGYRAETDGEASALATIPGAPLPASVIETFFETLRTAPLLSREYEPNPAYAEDYPAIALELRSGNDSVFFFSRPQGDRHVPWLAQAGSSKYVVPDDSPLRALEVLEPFFGLDPQSRAMKLLSPPVEEDKALSLWSKLEEHSGAEQALRVIRRLRALLDREVPEEDIVRSVEEYVSESYAPEEAPPAAASGDLLVAVSDPEAVRSLIAAGVDVEVRGRDGKTALMLAAESGRAETIQLLIDAGAKPNERTQRGATALTLASQNHRTEAVRLLLRAGADPNLRESDGSTALMRASEPNIVRALVRSRADVNAADENGLTAMMRLIERAAAAGDRADSLRSLLTAGANPRLADRQGRTALIWAVKGTPSTPSYPDLAAQLVEAGSDLEARDREGGTALVYAVIRGDAATARLLIDAGADVNARMGNLSAMELALRYGRSEIVTMLLRAGARR